MPFFSHVIGQNLLCDDSHIWHALVVFPQQKRLVSLSVLRMSALKHEFSVLLYMLEYPTLKYINVISPTESKYSAPKIARNESI